MADPTLKRSSVTIAYTASDGYSRKVCYSSIGRMGAKPPPHGPLLEAIEELSRLAELFGFGAQAADRMAEARARVKDWRSTRSAAQGVSDER